MCISSKVRRASCDSMGEERMMSLNLSLMRERLRGESIYSAGWIPVALEAYSGG